MSLVIVPIELAEANAFVAAHHRHHKPMNACLISRPDHFMPHQRLEFPKNALVGVIGTIKGLDRLTIHAAFFRYQQHRFIQFSIGFMSSGPDFGQLDQLIFRESFHWVVSRFVELES
ncbi:hypothetical protein [Paraburkholderia terrae]|uniref:hypothetical protein n=1 Tax=Paraburkholderia terrae TaxID=311230 RepID=UPI0020BF3687|nr:hypothetical protein [Paraburkholderia terrae]